MAAPDLVVVASPTPTTETEGGSVWMWGEVSGQQPLTYQWLRNGMPVSGATRALLTIPHLFTSDAGDYSLRVTNSTGSITTAAAAVTVLRAPTPIVAAEFRADPSLDGWPSALLPLDDGRLLVAEARNGQLLRLRADGIIDASFAVGVMTKASPNSPAVSALAVQSDGKILVGGEFTSFSGSARRHVARLMPDGVVDPTFDPAEVALSAPVRCLVVQPDGKILLANGTAVPIRLMPDGRVDPTFAPTAVSAPSTSLLSSYLVHGLALASDGTIYVDRELRAAPVSLPASPFVNARVDRLNFDGTFDARFPPITGLAAVTAMRTLASGELMLAGYLGRPLDTGPGPILIDFTPLPFVRRYLSSGAVDSSYSAALPLGSGHRFLGFDAVGRAYINGTYDWAASGADSMRSLVRLIPSGSLDPGFDSGFNDGLSVFVVAATPNGQVAVAGRFSIYNGVPTPRVAVLNVVASEALNAPAIHTAWAERTTVKVGEPLELRVAGTGSGSLTYTWRGPGVSIATSEPSLTVRPESAAANVEYSVRLSNSRGTSGAARVMVTVLPADPIILQQPSRVSFDSGRVGDLVVRTNPEARPLTGEWRKDGRWHSDIRLDGYGNVILAFAPVRSSDVGSYTVTVRNAAGAQITSAPIVLTVDDTSRFANLSTRAYAGIGDKSLIAGFSVPGSARRNLMIRGLGPALERFGVTEVLQDPYIVVFDANGRAVATNDNWGVQTAFRSLVNAAAFAAVGAFGLDAGSKDAALAIELAPGNYTVQLTGANGGTGNGLVEVYENDLRAERIGNLSSRVYVGANAQAIPGISIRGAVAKRILVRAIGPGLRPFGVEGTLDNPRLAVKRADGVTVATNDDWQNQSGAADVRDTAASVGAFSLPPGSKDAACVVMLPPGNYTAVTESVDGSGGVVLLEVYDTP